MEVAQVGNGERVHQVGGEGSGGVAGLDVLVQGVGGDGGGDGFHVGSFLGASMPG
jgi:hypothetical protein